MSITTLLFAYVGTPVPEPAEGGIDPQILSIIIGAVVSSTVFAAIVSGIFQFFNNKRNARILERKNEADTHNDVIQRYKEAAAEERQAKESAVRLMQNLLELAEDQIVGLKDTVQRLTSTIQVMGEAAGVQEGIIQQLTEDRDRVQRALDMAEQRLAAQKEELIRSQQEILDLRNKKTTD
jgi:uncharacterized membrane protein YccC